MQIDILYQPAYSLGVLKLEGNEEVRVEGGSMVSMSQGMVMETKAAGGILKSLARSVLGGESFFQNTYQAPPDGGEITVAPALPGDLFSLDLGGENLMVQSGSYVASAMGIEVDTSWGGAKTFFASEGLIMLRASGTGTLVLSSYGAIHERNLAEGETYTVDTGHLVAFTEGIGFKVRKVGGIKSTLFSGEGLVVDLTGPGRVLIQTRSTQAFLSWLIPQLPKTSNSGGGTSVTFGS
ncbi:MAG: TIGR00266 family protein [Chloroflexi bacterium]|nr:MAG: TIGR00266 family protein [Chloroflexota bacterium]MBL1196689.1 TIGR00266 family protein [Chloroflexota bacterium]NOH13982.1 TIGR00266 family protein [Chloroflexota bacterium]